MYVDVPAGTRARDVSCVIQPRRLNLRVRRAGAGNGSGSGGGGGDDADVVIDGELPSAVSRENSMWSLDDGKTVVISFEKTTRSWWKNVVEGDPEIDTTKVRLMFSLSAGSLHTAAAAAAVHTAHRVELKVEGEFILLCLSNRIGALLHRLGFAAVCVSPHAWFYSRRV